jgi:predicted  nucleic acid-binding Zn-ribbon protein
MAGFVLTYFTISMKLLGLYEQAKDEVGKMQYKRKWLINEIDFLNDKISKLQKTSYSLEQQQSCKMKEEHQEIQKFNDQKDSI